MSTEAQLKTRANVIIDTVREALELPDSEQLFYDYHASVGTDYFIELRSHLSGVGVKSDDEMQTSRYMYLNGPHEVGQCRPTLSLDINALVEESTVRGITDGYTEIPSLVDTSIGIDDRQQALLLQLHEVLEYYTRSGHIDEEQVKNLNHTFIDLLTEGSVVSLRQLSVKHADGTVLYLRSVSSNGSLEHVKYPFTDSNKVAVSACLSGEKTRTVLGVTSLGNLESWTELVNGLERMAQFAEPENISRDKTGRIIGVSGAGLDQKERIAIEAERAAGLRALEAGRVALVGAYVDELLRPLANRGE